MTIQKMTGEDVKIKLCLYGYAELQPGVYLEKMAQIQAEQEEWGDEDESKNEDFSSSPYWMTTDNGVDPRGFDSIEEACRSIE